MLNSSIASKNAGRGASVLSTTVYLSGVSIVVNQLLKPARMPEPTGGLAQTQDRVLHVVAGELATGVELDALAQVELELLAVAC